MPAISAFTNDAGYQTASGSVASASNATTAGCLAVGTSANAGINQIVRTNASGYIDCAWLNPTSSDNGTAAIARVFASTDSYIRYYTLANFSAQVTPAWANVQGKPSAFSDLVFIIDGGSSVLTTGVKGDLIVDFPCTINAWTLLADHTGSVVVNVWKVAYASFPATSANVITGSSIPTISAATKGQSSTLTGWITSIAAGDCLRFNVDSISTITGTVSGPRGFRSVRFPPVRKSKQKGGTL